MALIPLYEAKTYLRVDSSDEDALIGILLSSAEQMCNCLLYTSPSPRD